MDPAQFTITDKDTPESLASQSRDLARMMGGQTIDQRQRVQSTQVLADNTIAIVTDDGRIIRTNEKARTPQQPGEPLEQTVGADGRPVLTPRSQAAGQTPYAATAAKPQTEGDKRNSLMFDSMVNAEQQIAGMNAAGNTTDTSSKKDALLGLAGLSVAQSDDYKQYEAAGLRWAANLLYLKSGATATPDEIRSTWKQFFPQPGDGPANVQQKNAARVQEMQSAGRIVGRDVPQFGGGEVAPEGTVITSQDGRTMVKRNGQWVPQ